MKKFIAVALLLVTTFAVAQNDPSVINNYKVAIVPKKFSFLKEEDQYRLNTLTKMYMEKYGFKAYFDTDEIPPDDYVEEYAKVFVDLITETNMFQTKVIVVLRDYKKKELFRTEAGKSRDKDYKTSYQQALREAFNYFNTLGYEYNGGSGLAVLAPPPPPTRVSTPVKESKPVVVDKNTLFAQPVENGFQLVDTTPKVIFKLRKTSSDKVYMAEKGTQAGTLIEKEDGKWVFESYVDGKLVTETVSVKF
ncbi:MAG: hypothetical protein EOO50_12995 [Flavobacterium sp.]|uniref:hypothetical protein n=1 Tax=Flavobacterium sp. TaxID=239 RepID=UPI0012214B46|nr:hypothetical protein [Flavobacterium sp.]RZJ65660.1 MAG: hypothetical protein EOO50_12995 [Flavobacterium sp.]